MKFINNITNEASTGDIAGDYNDEPCEIKVEVLTKEEYIKILKDRIDYVNQVLFKEE